MMKKDSFNEKCDYNYKTMGNPAGPSKYSLHAAVPTLPGASYEPEDEDKIRSEDDEDNISTSVEEDSSDSDPLCDKKTVRSLPATFPKRMKTDPDLVPIHNPLQGKVPFLDKGKHLAFPGNSPKPGTSSENGQNILIGGEESYMVQRYDGQWYPAKVLECRRKDASIPAKELSLDQPVYEYYVHYDNFDRRLDEWVASSRITDASTAANGWQTAGTPCGMLLDSLSCDDAGLQGNLFEFRKMTRNQKRRHDDINHVQKTFDEMDPETAAIEMAHEAATKVKYINVIQFGNYNIDTWYFSPFPAPFGQSFKLYICEYCMKYTNCPRSYRKHTKECPHMQPPNIEVYRKGKISIWKADGEENKLYCQNLCLLSKLFLNHKSIMFEVALFYFYVLCEVDQYGAHFVGYFSKEKDLSVGNNLACILILPPHQQKGYGKLLIDFSYRLSELEGVTGSPEKPLSDLGKLTYRSYWAWVLLNILRQQHGNPPSFKALSEMTSITEEDIKDTLQALNLTKYWKGNDIICATSKVIEDYLKSSRLQKPKLLVDKSCIRWTPSKWKQLKTKVGRK